MNDVLLGKTDDFLNLGVGVVTEFSDILVFSTDSEYICFSSIGWTLADSNTKGSGKVLVCWVKVERLK